MLRMNQVGDGSIFPEKLSGKSSSFNINNPESARQFNSLLSKEIKVSNSSPDSSTLQGSSSADLAGADENMNEKVYLGKISGKISTVSELLYASPYKSDCWQILGRDVNSSKPFRKIRPGTDIYLDPKTSEIVWGKDLAKSVNDMPVSFKPESKFNNSNYHLQTQLQNEPQSLEEPALNDAVSKFIGRGYDQMDCYEMVVKGLQDIVIKYQGSNGLAKHLIDKAVGRGLPSNHYLNGEGLVAAAGNNIYHKSVLSVKNPDLQAEGVMHDMENFLKEGQILSFSTRTRGHTGVVSKNEDTWTFINSGNMDNNIAGKNGSREVGEEILSKEVENWFRLAGRRKEGLQITLGNIDMTKLATYKKSDVNRSTFTVPG